MITIGGVPCSELCLKMPKRGRWSASALVPNDAEFQGGDISDGTRTLVGYLAAQGGTSVLATAGTAALRADVGARSYRATDVKTVVADTVGALYSSKSTPAVAKTKLNYWTRLRGPATDALRTLSEHLGCTWRVLDDGTVWIGTDAYAAIDDFDATVLDVDPISESVLVGVPDLRLRVGVTWRGYRVRALEYSFDGSESLRATIFL